MASAWILIVDDDQNNCLVTKRLLTDEGYDVDTANDALSALKLFGEQGVVERAECCQRLGIAACFFPSRRFNQTIFKLCLAPDQNHHDDDVNQPNQHDGPIQQ